MRIISLGNLEKRHIDREKGHGFYSEIISASDGLLSDTKRVNITVIEINHAPNISKIGVQTIWTSGENSSFYKQAVVNDMEDGNQNSYFIFNLTFLNGEKLFNITTNGTMTFDTKILDLNKTSIPFTYNISLCARDSGLRAIHPRINVECGQDGSFIEVCENFSLTLTNENRPPTIMQHYPISFNLTVNGEEKLYFNITGHDPDGTIPDAYWYVDNVLAEYDEGRSFNEFRYSFGCGISGDHKIKAVISDGLLNDSLQWNLTVKGASCPEAAGGGGGGGGGSAIKRCEEKWVCLDWNICQDIKSSLEFGILGGDDFRNIKKECESNFFADNCGFQIRECYDSSFCNKSVNKPERIGACHFVSNPGCSDGIKNCHSGDCEVLTDCGGPCNPCPTCSDRIENQGEEEIDCGGPCPLQCPEKVPVLRNISTQFILFSSIALLVAIVFIQLIRIWWIRRKMENE